MSAPHLVAAFDHIAGAALGPVAVTAKSNEIPAGRTLLPGGDYLVAITANRPSLPPRSIRASAASLERVPRPGGHVRFGL